MLHHRQLNNIVVDKKIREHVSSFYGGAWLSWMEVPMETKDKIWETFVVRITCVIGINMCNHKKSIGGVVTFCCCCVDAIGEHKRKLALELGHELSHQELFKSCYG